MQNQTQEVPNNKKDEQTNSFEEQNVSFNNQDVEDVKQTKGTQEASEQQETTQDASEQQEATQIKNLENQLKLILADFSNYKKRVQKEKEQFCFTECSNLIKLFLTFREHLKKAIKHETQESSLKNLKELEKNYLNMLSRSSIKQLELLGKDYDYNVSECVQVITCEKEKHNKVLEALEDAYTYKDILIKPAKVIIGKFMEE